MALKSGDFAKIEFVGTRAGIGDIVDTNIADKAKEAGIFSEKTKYGPSLVVVGKRQVIPGVDDALVGMSAGETKKESIPAEKAFGLRRPDFVRVMPLSEFHKRDIDPYPGMPVQLDDMNAIVKSVTSGRVLVDMNHPLAGANMLYDIKVTEAVEGTEKKVAAMLDHFSLKGAVKLEGDLAEVTFPADVKKDANYLINKSSAFTELIALLPEVKRIRCIEEYERGKGADAGAGTEGSHVHAEPHSHEGHEHGQPHESEHDIAREQKHEHEGKHEHGHERKPEHEHGHEQHQH